MHRLYHFEYIDITSIDLADPTYLLCPLDQVAPDEELIESIRQFGVLTPPLLRQRKNKLIIAAGRKRILAARQVGIDNKILCGLVPEGTEEQNVYQLIVEETLCGGHLSLIEQAKFFADFLAFAQTDEALPLLARLGHKPQKHVLDELISLLTLSAATLIAVHRNIIPLSSVRKIRRLSPPDQDVLVQIISSLNLGGSKQHKLIDYCTELAVRTKIPLKDLLGEFITVDAPDNHENIPQKAAALLLWLHKQCFPKSTEAEDEFKKSVARLRLPDHIRLEHSPAFEDDRVTLAVNFPDMKAVNKLLPEILRITDKSEGQDQ